MKKPVCLFLAMFLCLTFIGCDEVRSETKTITNAAVKLLYETKDQHDNILTQTFYDEKNDEYWLREYTYKLDGTLWVCVDQQTTIIKSKENIQNNNSNIDPSLKICYNSDLTDRPITIINNEYTKVSIVKYLTEDNWWEFGYELKVVNKTNNTITMTIDSVSIMDINCKPLFSIDHIDAGNTAYFTLAWDKDTLTKNYIPYIDNIEFMVRIFDNENWNIPALAGSRIMLKK